MSNPTFAISALIDEVNWVELATVFERAPLGHRDPVQLEKSFRNSGCYCFAYLDRELIGAGRALTDRMNYAFILDVVVLPEYQGNGYGKAIMQYLASGAGAKNLVLHSVPEKQAFYANLGYRKMKTAMALFHNPAFWQEQGYIE